MKQMIFLLLFFLILFSSNEVHAQQKQLPFCEGMKIVQKAFQEGKASELKDTVWSQNKYIFSSKIDIDDVTDEFVGTNIGTYYRVTYRSTASKVEQEKFMNELVNKLEQCFDKKAKKSEINGYKVKAGKVVFSAMHLGSRAVILSISDEE